MRLVRFALVIAGLTVAVLAGPSISNAVDLVACTDLICAFNGDFAVESLPLAGLSIQSSPGQIQNGVVVYTGSNGVPVTTNFAGMDNAYPAVGGKSGGTTFSTTTTADPGGTGEFAGDAAGTWDSTLTAFTTFLNGATPIFFFNQNQLNSGVASANCPLATSAQDVCVYGMLTLVDLDNSANNVTLELEGPTTLFSGGPQPTDGIADLPDELILARGAVCLDAVGNQVACDGNQAVGPINHNLGANEAAYAAFSDALNALLATCAAEGVNTTNCPWDSISLRFDLGGLNNGFEQLFILTSEFVIPPPPVPVPATLLLLGSGLVGLGGGMAWRTRRRG
ncbi:MAG TPA: hypothetical protein VFX14_23370 [Methylomirabilota bacterium]|nr:hypothetical protein [Methylomirabilota bacterium]